MLGAALPLPGIRTTPKTTASSEQPSETTIGV
jgi:hypothetical protein